jgi:transglutaminase-like putative cysteine protease
VVEIAERAADEGLTSVAAAALDQLYAAHPSLKVMRARAELAVRRSRRPEAEQRFRAVLEQQHDDEEALRELYSLARDRGAEAEAAGWLDRLAALARAPELLAVAYDRAELSDGLGHTAEAVAALERARALVPDDARLLERLGRLEHRLGRDAVALDHLRRSLELKPQNPELRAYLPLLSQTRAGDDLRKAYAVDVRRLVATAPPIRHDASDPARVLLDSSATRVHKNGLAESYVQRVVQILDERGAREQGDFDIRYTPDTQSIEVRAARVYRPDGDVIEANTTEEHDLSEPWYGLYYDVRAQVIRFSGLSPGDVVDVEYTVSDVARRNQLADYFGDVHFFAEELPRVESRYVLIAPKERRLYFNRPRLPDLEQKEREAGDERVYSFVARAVAKVHPEPGMPGYSDLAPYLHVSTYRSWQAVATWYQGLVREQLVPSEAIRRAAREAVAHLTDERARIRAVYDLVVRRTRYVGLEFGIHGYQPYRVSQVFARKFGDCKDKASLLAVMLREIGVDATLVLARTRRGGDIDAEPASLAPFDHAIVYVPKYRLYLDGTAEFSGSKELPAQDQDIPVLLVGTGQLVRTPVLPAQANRVATEWRVALQADGAARVEEQLSIVGEAAHEWRAHYQAPGERKERYGKAWSGKHPGASLEELAMPGVEDIERPIEVHATLAVPRWARRRPGEHEGTLVMPALGREADMLRSYARLSARQHDLVLGYPWTQDERVAVALPPGYQASRLPEPRQVTAPFGRFELTVERVRGEVVVGAHLVVERHRIARTDYPAFRRFCADVDAAVAQELVLERAAPAPRPARPATTSVP